MIILAIDCAASLCAASAYDATASRELGREVRDLGKGHAEHLMDVIGVALAAAGLSYADIDRVGVCVGPGSFTGVRVGVSTARGLALALKVPAVGVTSLEAIADEARAGAAGDRDGADIMAAIDAGRDGIYVGVYDRFGSVRYDPAVMTLEEAAALASSGGQVLAGSAAARIAGLVEGAKLSGFEGATADIGVYARLAAEKDPAVAVRPAPLYLRAPDAKPQAGFILPRRGS